MLLTPPATNPDRAVAAWVPWVLVSVTALVLAVALVIVDSPSAPVGGGAAVHYVPLDGHRTLTTDGDGAVTVTEHTRRFGVDGALDAPVMLVNAMLEQWGDPGIREAQFWRASRTDEQGVRTTDLYRLSERGISQVASWGGALGFVFNPELVVLPASAAAGDSWTAEGDALPGGVLTYTASASVVPVTGALLDYDGVEISQQGGCIGVQFSLVITDPSDGATTTLDEGTAWCAGRGPVWSAGTINGESVGLAELPIRPLDPRGEYPAATLEPAEGDLGLSASREVALHVSDAFFGAHPSVGRYVLPARAAATDLVLVDDQGDSLQRWALGDSGASLRWSGRPGGTIVAAASVGSLTVATTDLRQVAAYDAIGRRIWSTTTDELVIDAPIAIGRDLIVLTRAGTVIRLDGATGVPQWSVSLGADGRGEPLVIGDIVLAADERERLTALDARTGDVLWRVDAGATEAMTVDQAEQTVIVVTEEGAVAALSLTDGETVWRSAVTGSVRAIAGVPGVVVVASDEIVLGLDAATGAELWRGVGAQAAARAGDVVVMLVGDEVVVRHSATGLELDRDNIAPIAPGVWRSLVVAGSTAVVVDSSGVLHVWELR
ncbi:MAG: PQQ-binding-like beta-propeller repeat protein [Microcella sp.]|nr:PQQ-binding-like beta-propeller repeat protein [Microcella sp.]